MLFFHPQNCLCFPKYRGLRDMRPSALFFLQSLGLSCFRILVHRTKNLKQHWDGCWRCSRLIHIRWKVPPKYSSGCFTRDACSATAPTIYKQSPALLPLFFYLPHSSKFTQKLLVQLRWAGIFLRYRIHIRKESTLCHMSFLWTKALLSKRWKGRIITEWWRAPSCVFSHTSRLPLSRHSTYLWDLSTA